MEQQQNPPVGTAKEIKYIPPELAEQFILSKAPLCGILGPLGSGKSVASVMKINYHARLTLKSAADGLRHTRWVVIRNTSDQLRDTTIKTWLQWFPTGSIGEYKEYTRTYYIKYGDVRADVLFRALDREQDARRVLSLDTTGAFLNEWREINELIFNSVRGRCGRYPNREPLSLTLMHINDMTFEQLKERHNREVDHLDEKPRFKIPAHVTENNYMDFLNAEGELIYTDERYPSLYQQPVKISLYDWFGIIADTNPPDETHYIYELFEKEEKDRKKIEKRFGVKAGQPTAHTLLTERKGSPELYGEVIKVYWRKGALKESVFADDPPVEYPANTGADAPDPHTDPTINAIIEKTIPKSATPVIPGAEPEVYIPTVQTPPPTSGHFPAPLLPNAIPTSGVPALFQPRVSASPIAPQHKANKPPVQSDRDRFNKPVLNFNTQQHDDMTRARHILDELTRSVTEQLTAVRKQHGATLGIPHQLDSADERYSPFHWLFIKQPSGLSPHAENYINLPPNYYANLMSGASEQWRSVHVNAQYGATIDGTPVFADSFNKHFHTRPQLMYNPLAPLVIGLDFGRTPAAIVLQKQPNGRVYALKEFIAVGMGLEMFIITVLKPGLQLHFPNARVIISGDPAGAAMQQGPEMSLYDTLEQAGFQLAYPGTNKILDRLRAVEYWLKLNIAGEAVFLFDTVQCPQLVRGLERHYHYKKRRSGETNAVPLKNEYSHIADALQYACLVLHEDHSGSLNHLGTPHNMLRAPEGENLMAGWV